MDDDALWPKAKMEITAAVPMTIPIIVKMDRMRFDHNDSNAAPKNSQSFTTRATSSATGMLRLAP